jgi:cytochrome oxidase Cu insertion factor (SCO1/SenC/PrrC family)
MTEPHDGDVRRGRVQLLGLVAVFVVPVLVATAWYFTGAHGVPAAQTHGTLIDPAHPLEAFEVESAAGETVDRATLRGHWTLLQTIGAACRGDCQERVYYTRQIHDALAQDRVRVRRAALAFDGATTPGLADIRDGHPRLMILEGEPGGPLMRQLPSAPDSTTVYLIDPLGNVMLRFDGDVAPDAILDDIEHALDSSQIG